MHSMHSTVPEQHYAEVSHNSALAVVRTEWCCRHCAATWSCFDLLRMTEQLVGLDPTLYQIPLSQAEYLDNLPGVVEASSAYRWPLILIQIFARRLGRAPRATR